MTCAGRSMSTESRKTILAMLLLWNNGWKKSSLPIEINESLVVIFVSTILCKILTSLNLWEEEVDIKACFC